eukprot:5447310-Amphidinium_carterae.1
MAMLWRSKSRQRHTLSLHLHQRFDKLSLSHQDKQSVIRALSRFQLRRHTGTYRMPDVDALRVSVHFSSSHVIQAGARHDQCGLLDRHALIMISLGASCDAA